MRKKLFAVIMSVMMLVTFMPTMAFAAGHEGWHTDIAISDVKWDDNYQGATASLVCAATGCTKTYGTIHAKASCEWDFEDGIIESYVNFSDAFYQEFGDSYSLAGDSEEYTYFYDLNGANLVNDYGRDSSGDWDPTQKGTKKEMLKADDYLDGDLPFEYLELVQPEYTFQGDQTKPQYAWETLHHGDGSFYWIGDGYIYDSEFDEYFDKETPVIRIEITDTGYEAYEADKNVDYTISYETYNKTVNWAEIGVVNADKASTKETVLVSANNASFDWLQFSMKGYGTGYLWSWTEKDTTIEEAIVDLSHGDSKFYEIPTAYVGEDQNFQITTKGVNVEYYTVDKLGNATKVDKAPTMKDVKIEEDPLYHDNFYHFIVRVTRGNSDAYFPVAVKITPAVLDYGFTKTSFTFGENQNVNNSTLLKARVASPGEDNSVNYYSLYNSLGNFLGADDSDEWEDVENMADELKPVMDSAMKLVQLFGTKKNVYSADKAAVENILDNYATVDEVDTSVLGESNVNVTLDTDAITEAVAKDPALAQAMANYDFTSSTVAGYTDLLKSVETDLGFEFGITGDISGLISSDSYMNGYAGANLEYGFIFIPITRDNTGDPTQWLVLYNNEIATGAGAGFNAGIKVKADEVANLIAKKVLPKTAKAVVTDRANQVKFSDRRKTYHVKKATKLKAAKSFKLAATAKYGDVSFYKVTGRYTRINVSEDGVVSIKKGLKKGTYKVKVRACAPNKEITRTITIRVTK